MIDFFNQFTQRTAPTNFPFAFCLLLWLSFAVSAFATDVATVRLLANARVPGDDILLGQIAEISGPHGLVAELKGISVAQSAAFGLTRFLDGENVTTRLQDRYPGKTLVSNPRTRVAVATEADTLPADSLAARMERFLARQPVVSGGRMRFSWVRQPPVITVPKTSHALRLEFSTRKHRGKVELGLAVDINGAVARTYPLLADFTIEEPVRVAYRRIDRGETLGDGNTRLEVRETTHFEPEALPGPEALGMQAKVSISEGRILTRNVIAWPPAVKRGEAARLVVRNGGVRIATEVVCRQDGIPGQIISARHPETHRLLRARVLRRGELEPVPEGGT